MASLNGKHRLSAADEAEFAELATETDGLMRHVEQLDADERRAMVDAANGRGDGRIRIEAGTPGDGRRHGDSTRDAALRTLDAAVSAGTMAARGAETIETVMGTGAPQHRNWAGRWAATTGDNDYLTAFAKVVADPVRGHMLFTDREAEAFRAGAALMSERAMSTTDNAGGYLIPAALDAAILLSSNGSTNPLREIARTEVTVGDTWNGVSSAGVTASWDAEAAEVSDDSPTLAQPSVPLYKGAAFVPFSIEVEQDAPAFVAEVTRLLLDSIEQLTATAYVTGSGSGEPTGFVTALAGGASVVTGDGSEALADSDPVKLQNALPPRFQPNSAFLAALPTLNTLRIAETSAGALLYPSLQTSPPTLLGRPVYEASTMDSAVNAAATEANYLIAVGDWSHFLIATKIGTVVELVPHVFGSNRRPTGQRGFYCHFRTGSDVLVDNAIRLLNVPTAA
ncbi:MAG: phage major capsid protein [Mycolicibacterium sp.]|nr:phage major capsid protein [Mycolicibacterium sp.]MCB9424193.1 phage major capsid protein [Actinomycetota bacterium]